LRFVKFSRNWSLYFDDRQMTAGVLVIVFIRSCLCEIGYLWMSGPKWCASVFDIFKVQPSIYLIVLCILPGMICISDLISVM